MSKPDPNDPVPNPGSHEVPITTGDYYRVQVIDDPQAVIDAVRAAGQSVPDILQRWEDSDDNPRKKPKPPKGGGNQQQ